MTDDAANRSRLVLLTRREAAAEVRCSVQTLKRRIDAGELAEIRIGGRVFIAASDLDQFVMSRRRVARAAAAPSNGAGVTYQAGEKWWRR